MEKRNSYFIKIKGRGISKVLLSNKQYEVLYELSKESFNWLDLEYVTTVKKCWYCDKELSIKEQDKTYCSNTCCKKFGEYVDKQNERISIIRAKHNASLVGF
jgi:hypothetical protein